MSVITVAKSPLMSYSPAHAHDVWEIVLNLRGSGYMIIGDTQYPYEPGTIICQPPDLAHSKYSDDVFQDIFIQPTTFSLAGPGDTNGVLVFQDDADKSFETLMRMANQIYHKNEDHSRQVVDALYDAMEQLMVSWYRIRPKNKSVEQLKNHLVSSFTDPECAVSAGRVEKYCDDHMRRLFKQETGFTPQQYLLELRINYAKKLIRNNARLHYSVAEISLMCGFYDSAYFSRLFKKKTGMTPTEYQERHIAEQAAAVRRPPGCGRY
jgi:AraC-like DNA-binding protein